MDTLHPVGFGLFLKQGLWFGRRVVVCFNYDTLRTIGGTIIREDEEAPSLMLIYLDDGRVVRSMEWQYSFPPEAPKRSTDAPGLEPIASYRPGAG